MKKLIILFSALLIMGCSRTIYVPVESKITTIETVRDTIVDVRIERETVMQTVQDTTSTVETKYARSVATWHGGALDHSITNKEGAIATPIQYIDREVTVEKPAPYPVEVEVEVDRPVRMPLRWYERVLQTLGIALLGGGVVYGAVRIKR